MNGQRPTTLGYAGLTGTVYVLLRNGQKRPVPENELVTVISAYLDGHDLVVTKPDGTRVSYEAVSSDLTLATLSEVQLREALIDIFAITCGVDTLYTADEAIKQIDIHPAIQKAAIVALTPPKEESENRR